MATINHWWQQVRLIVAVLMLVAVAGFVGAQWQQRTDAGERMQMLNRFPKVRADAAASATEAADAKYAIELNGLRRENETLRESQDLIAKSVADTHEISAYTLRFLGDRAQKTDARQQQVIKKLNEATKAATVAAQKTEVVVQKTEVVEQKVNVATAKAQEAATTAKAVDKKLDTATYPAAQVPRTPWAGGK